MQIDFASGEGHMKIDFASGEGDMKIDLRCGLGVASEEGEYMTALRIGRAHV